MQIHSRKMNVSPDVNFDELARSTDDFNGAQCKAVCVEAVSDPGGIRDRVGRNGGGGSVVSRDFAVDCAKGLGGVLNIGNGQILSLALWFGVLIEVLSHSQFALILTDLSRFITRIVCFTETNTS